MKAPWRYLAIFLLAFGLLLILTSPPARADHNTTLPAVPTAKMKLAMARGTLTVRFDEGTAAYPQFRAQAWQVFMDHFAQIGIDYVEIQSGTPDVWFTFPEDSQFLNQCGNGAAACITYASSPVVIAYRRSLLFAFWTTTHGHEMGHLLGLHERYSDSGGQFACKPISQEAYPTVMNCGTGRFLLQPTDVSLIRGLMVPRPVAGFYGMSYTADGAFGYYCGSDAARGLRTAVMAIAPDGTAYWSGLHLPVGPGCFSFRIAGDPGWCYNVLVENAFSWRVYEQRNEVRLGCL